MPLRWVWTGLPLAIFIAVLAHVAGFGFSHAAGGAYALGLFGAFVVGLLLRIGSAFAGPARMPSRDPVAGFSGVPGMLGLASVAGCAFAAIEFVEGHEIVAAGLVPVFALIPLTWLVRVLVRRLETAADTAGVRALTYLKRVCERIAGMYVRREQIRGHARATAAGRTASGRAPPRFA